MTSGNNPTLKRKAASGLFWNVTDRMFTRGIQFVFSIIIARKLMPEDYGVIAIINFFLAIAQTLIDSGFGAALMKKEDRNETDFNTVFYFNIVVSIFLYAVFWFLAPFISHYYDNPILVPTTRVVMISLLVNAISFTQNVQLQLQLKFNVRTWISFASNLCSGIIGILMAYKGFGVWALAIQTPVAIGLQSVLLLVAIRWRPHLCFSFQSLKEMFSFGSLLLVSDYLDQLYNGIYTLTIGKALSTSALGVYGKANAFADTPSTLIAGPIRSVFYPVFCNIQDQPKVRIIYFRKMLVLTAYISFPTLIGLAAVADPTVRLLLTDNWADMILPLKILCFAFVLPPITTLCRTLILSYGDSRGNLRIQLISKSVGILLLLLLVPMGVNAVCYGVIITFATAFILYFIRSHHFIELNWKQVIPELLIPFLFSLIMYFIVSYLMYHISNTYLKIAIGILSGVSIYGLLSIVFKPRGWRFLIETVSSL